MPDHEELQGEIPAYVASRLRGEELRRVEAHLDECDTCAELAESWKDVARALREGGEELFSPHPNELTLRQYALGAVRQDQAAIRSHVESCAACELEVSVWRARDSGAHPRPGHGAGDTSAPRRVSYGAHAAALAAGLVLGAGLVALLRTRTPVPAAPPGAERPVASATALESGPLPLLVLGSPLRGEEASPTLAPGPGVSHVLIAVQPVIPAAAADTDLYRFEILGSSGATLWRSELAASRIRRLMEASDAVTFPVPAAALSPGGYVLRLLGLAPGEAAPLLEIPFTIAP